MNDEKPCQDFPAGARADTISDWCKVAHVSVASDPPSSRALAEGFSRPFNWCDRRCERCPLADECPVNRRELQRRWVHEARREDHDSMAVAVSDVEEELSRALALAREIASEEGIDLNAPLPPVPISLEAVKLRRAGLDLAIALHAALDLQGAELPPATSPAVDDAFTASATLAAKCARIGGYLAERNDDTWTADAVPNLLLMERLRASCRTSAMCGPHVHAGKATLLALRRAAVRPRRGTLRDSYGARPG
jgi:hypothetical protein